MTLPLPRPSSAAATAPVDEALLEALPHAAWVVELARAVVVAANSQAAATFGVPAALLAGRAAESLVASPEDLAYWSAAAAGRVDRIESDVVVALPGDRVAHAWRAIRPLPRGDGGAPSHVLVLLAEKAAERRIDDDRETQLADLRAMLEATADGLLVTDADGRIVAFNRRFAELWQLPAELLRRRDDAAIVARMRDAVDDPRAYDARLEALAQATLVTAVDRLELHDGPLVERVSRPLLRVGRPHGRVWSFRDLGERAATAEAGDAATAASDALTGLANRRGLAARIDAAADAVRDGGSGFALLVVDLDRFRHINDSLGEAVGDHVLVDVARRIQAGMRHGDTLARLAGDQFALLVAAADAAAAEAAARRVLNVVARPCNVDGVPFTLTCSIGVALAPSHGWTADELVRRAEAAMRAAKAGGRAGFRFHQLRAEVDRGGQIRIDHAMRQALVAGRFRLHYQPQVALDDGRVVGAEALLRWHDPELGDVAPARFIPVAEDSGFIVPLGDWVLSQAVRQAAQWHERGQALPVAVNVSALQFQQAHFVDRVASVLAVSGLPPALLELELTESILVHDADEALHRLQALARIGVRLSIDDFGTGYSSLAYLKRFPIGKLKIDRSFVAGLPDDDGDAAIVRAILQMARALGLRVIAEGVETDAQRRFLQVEGCSEYQGWLFAPALDTPSFEQRIAGAPQPPPAPAAPRPPRMRLVR